LVVNPPRDLPMACWLFSPAVPTSHGGEVEADRLNADVRQPFALQMLKNRIQHAIVGFVRDFSILSVEGRMPNPECPANNSTE
jgi:hypothetical protein